MALSSGIWVGGKYRVERELGEGGMGFVYEATHVKLGAKVAIKLLREEILRVPGVRERFFREASVSARIVHPRVARVTDVDEDPQLGPYMVMDLLRGENLGDVLGRGERLDLPTISVLIEQTLDGLSAAHAIGVVHRDLKPENLYLAGGLAARDVRIIDFGIAKVKDAAGQALTAAGTLMGTAEYMAPEQVRSANTVDARADLYSVGVIAYELLSGVRPFEGLDPVRASLRAEKGDWTKLHVLRPDLSPGWIELVHTAMAASPHARYTSADAMKQALVALRQSQTSQPVAAGAQSVNPRAKTLIDTSGEEKTNVHQAHVPVQRAASPPPAYVPSIPVAPIPASPHAVRQARGSSRGPVVMLLLGGALLVAAGVGVYLTNQSDGPAPFVAPSTPTVAPAAVPPAATPQAASSTASPEPPSTLPTVGNPTAPTPPIAPNATRPGAALPKPDAGPQVDSGANVAPLNTLIPPIQLPTELPQQLPDLQKLVPGMPAIPGFPAPTPTPTPSPSPKDNGEQKGN